MSGQIPLELIDLIFSFIPLQEVWSPKTPNITLFNCSLASRSFCLASRRRLFSTVFIGPSSTVPKTGTKLKALFKLFEDRPELLLSTHAVQINLDRGKSRKWAVLNDAVLGRIFTMIKTRPRKLDGLRIECRRAPDFDLAFGRRTKQAIMDLLPDVHSLTLSDMFVPSTFMEKFPPLKCLYIRNLRITSQTNASKVPPPAFADTSDVSIDLSSLWGIHQFYQRSRQSPPAYINLIINILSPPRSQMPLNDILCSSVHSLRNLTIQPEVSMDTNHTLLDLSQFRRLTTIRVKYTTFAFHSACRVLYALKIWLDFGATLLGSASSPSNFVNFEIEIYCLDTVEGIGDIEKTMEILSSMQCINEFHPKNLVNRHPKLESIQVKIASPSFNKAKDHDVSAFRRAGERYIQKLLPVALPVPVTDFDFDKAIAYYIPLDQL